MISLILETLVVYRSEAAVMRLKANYKQHDQRKVETHIQKTVFLSRKDANRFPLILNGGSHPRPNRNSKCIFIIRGVFIEMPCSGLQVYSSNQVLKCSVN